MNYKSFKSSSFVMLEYDVNIQYYFIFLVNNTP